MKRGPIVTTASLTLTASLALTPTAALADGFRGGAGRTGPGPSADAERRRVSARAIRAPRRRGDGAVHLGLDPESPAASAAAGAASRSASRSAGIGEPGARAPQPSLPLDGRARGDALDGSLGRGPAGVPRAGDTIPALLSRQAGGRAPIRRGCPA